MPRRPRTHLDDVPLHIVQRGHNRAPCFFAEEDYFAYLHWLGEALKETGVRPACLCADDQPRASAAHACPRRAGAPADDLPRAPLRAVHQHHLPPYRHAVGQRYKSSLIQAETWLLGCMRYIELNPARAAMVDAPAH